MVVSVVSSRVVGLSGSKVSSRVESIEWAEGGAEKIRSDHYHYYLLCQLTVAQFIYFVAISGIAVNYVLFNSIVLNSVLNDMVNDMSVLTAK